MNGDAWLPAGRSAAREGGYELPPMWSWQEFLDRARAPDTISYGRGRHNTGEWPGATWAEALRLATDGWTVRVPEVEIAVAALRERVRDEVMTTMLVPTWDVTGSEVDVGAYLSGVPECMVDATPQRVSTRGRVVTFLVPAGFVNTTPHASVRHRGLALTALCSAIIAAGHSAEVWSGMCVHVEGERYVSVARVISAAEPFDLGRLIFVLAHPAMLRRLWLSVWDSAPPEHAARICGDAYGQGPFSCRPDDLPDGIGDPYVLPYLEPTDPQWRTFESAMDWCAGVFRELGLVRDGGRDGAAR
ncbi:hypothetical protein [Streptomyces sp. NBRC 109706]|uniref:DUF7192 family protein n=1 Tax=Streptomyces sp. NBRC 109706 TaxID=1550035 RepID=UPI000A503F4B|nr:hypothetical protein [Streptomyces sp. NBRC 109706]